MTDEDILRIWDEIEPSGQNITLDFARRILDEAQSCAEPVAWAKPEDLLQDGYTHSFYVHQALPVKGGYVPLYAAPHAGADAEFDALALRVLNEMRSRIGQAWVYGEDWHVEYARRLRAAMASAEAAPVATVANGGIVGLYARWLDTSKIKAGDFLYAHQPTSQRAGQRIAALEEEVERLRASIEAKEDKS